MAGGSSQGDEASFPRRRTLMQETIVSRQTLPNVLFVDAREATDALRPLLDARGFNFCSAGSGQEAFDLLTENVIDVVVSEEVVSGTTGIELLASVRERFPETGRILLSARPSVETILRAINTAEIFRFLVKPCSADEIGAAIHDALRLCHQHRVAATWKERARVHYREALKASFERALSKMWIAFQPIIRAKDQSLYGYEALLRCTDPDLSSPSVLFALAYELGRSLDLGRRSRTLIALRMERAPEGSVVLVNVHPDQLCDRKLSSGQDPLTAHAPRIVLKVLESKSLPKLVGSELAIASLRKLGYRIAADELAAEPSHAGEIALVTPDIMRLEMGLVRDLHLSKTNQESIRTIIEACRAVGIVTLAQGVETPEEHEALVALGCDLMQGFLYGPAAREFLAPAVS